MCCRVENAHRIPDPEDPVSNPPSPRADITISESGGPPTQSGATERAPNRPVLPVPVVSYDLPYSTAYHLYVSPIPLSAQRLNESYFVIFLCARLHYFVAGWTTLWWTTVWFIVFANRSQCQASSPILWQTNAALVALVSVIILFETGVRVVIGMPFN